MCKLCALSSRSTLLFGSTPVSLPNLDKVFLQSGHLQKFLNWRQIFKRRIRGLTQMKQFFFFCLKYRAKPGLHDKHNFFHEIASCAKFFLSRPVLAKIFQQEKKGLGPFQLPKFFYFFYGVFLDLRGSSDKNLSPFGEQEKL